MFLRKTQIQGRQKTPLNLRREVKVETHQVQLAQDSTLCIFLPEEASREGDQYRDASHDR